MTAQSPGMRARRPPSDGSWVKRLYQLLVLAGVEPLRILHTARTLPVYLRNYRAYRRLQGGSAPPVHLEARFITDIVEKGKPLLSEVSDHAPR